MVYSIINHSGGGMNSHSFLLTFSFLLVIFVLGGCSENNPNSTNNNPVVGPTATEVFTQYPATVWHGIAGLQYQSIEGMMPGFLVMVNTGIVSARSTAQRIEYYSDNDTIGYTYGSDGWYSWQRDTLSGSINTRWRLDPDPFHNSGVTPIDYSLDIRFTTVDSANQTTTTFTQTIVNHLRIGSYNGTCNFGYRMESSVLGVRNIDIPVVWTNLNCQRVGGIYLWPEGDFSSSGTSLLGLNQTTGQPISYLFDGRWNVPFGVLEMDSVGYVKVGGELFATYYFTSFNTTTGVYQGQYQFANGGTVGYDFTMTGSQ